MTQRRSDRRRRVITSAPGAESPPRIRRPHRRRGGAGGGAAATLGTFFLLAGMRSARRTAILMVMALRCLIVDDNAGFLRSARLLLEREGIDVVAVASPGEEGRRQTPELRPDGVPPHLDLGAAGGVEVAGRLPAESPGSPPTVARVPTPTQEGLAQLAPPRPARGLLAE